MHPETQCSYVQGWFVCEILPVREERREGGGVSLTSPHTHSRICRHSQHYLVWRAAPAHNISIFAHIIPSPMLTLSSPTLPRSSVLFKFLIPSLYSNTICLTSLSRTKKKGLVCPWLQICQRSFVSGYQHSYDWGKGGGTAGIITIFLELHEECWIGS